jgi:hypothetical protein
MRGLPTIPASASSRTRRWDAVIVGGSLPGLAAGVVLGMRGARILVVEEESAAAGFPGLREPFFCPGAAPDGVLGACLRELGIPLIDRKRLAPEPLAYQVVFPDARLDAGGPALTVDELVAWGFAKPDAARALVRALEGAAAAEREAMLEAPLLRTGRIRSRGSRPGPPANRTGNPVRHARGLPAEVTGAPEELAALLAAQVRALSNLGRAQPSPEARARLLGVALEGGMPVGPGVPDLHALLRRRIEALHGEFRVLPGPFRLVSASNRPGLALEDSGDVWVGRVLVLNAPRTALAAALDQQSTPDALAGAQATGRRLALHFRVRRAALPESMAARVICVSDPTRPMEGTNVVTLRAFPGARGRDAVDLVASAVVPAREAELEAREAEIEAAVSKLLPFSEGSLARDGAPRPSWDSDSPLPDPPRSGGWPGETEVRVSARPPVYALERGCVGGLGAEGDILLGWRAGDAIAADLA